jgi:sulfur carrier protein ThiS
MTAVLRAIGMLKSYVNDQAEVEIPSGVSVRDALKSTGMIPELVALVLVNDEQKDKDYILQDGDVLRVMAVIGGG